MKVGAVTLVFRLNSENVVRVRYQKTLLAEVVEIYEFDHDLGVHMLSLIHI